MKSMRIKRCLDFVVALLGLVSLSPLLAMLALVVLVFIGRPVLFKQDRPGLRGVPFRMLKFRTMSNEQCAKGALLPDAQRMTRCGRLLRATSLDELPELWNVLKGDMSLVGPRPLLVEYLPLYTSDQARRHNVRPGITGWAQINGRNALSWEERFALDIWYVDNRSFLLDLWILWRTIRKVLMRDGISYTDEITMPKFTGSPR